MGRGKSKAGKNSGRQWSNNAVGFLRNETLADALGEKGRPMSMREAMRGANPYYDKSGTYREYNENCQRCVFAYEARRRGYDVIAQGTFQGDDTGAVAYINPQTGYRMNRWMGYFQGAKPKSVGAATPQKAQERMETLMKQWGNGSRAIMQVVWGDGSGSHVINVEYKNGKIRYIDAQKGVARSTHLFQEIDLRYTQLVRVDNLKFSDRAKNAVMQRN